MKKQYAKKQLAQTIRQMQWVYSLSAVVSVVAIGLLVWFGFQLDGNEQTEPFPEIPKEERCDFERVLDGVCVANEDAVNPLLTAVMIENHPDARPLSGLADASIVYEAPVEANFSRFMAIFPIGTRVEKAGPVRSARPYYLDWLSEYGEPMYMHVGGSPEALRKIKEYELYDRNEFQYGRKNFWRNKARFAPHNVYTSSELWEDAHEERDWETVPSYAGWKFGDSEACDTEQTEAGCASEVTVTFNGRTYEAVWKYNSSTQHYERYQTGRRHKDLGGVEIVADNIIVQFVSSTVLDGEGRLRIDTIGDGKAMMFRDGSVTEGRWSKASRTDRTRFYTGAGAEIALKPGKIWIEIVNERAEATFK